MKATLLAMFLIVSSVFSAELGTKLDLTKDVKLEKSLMTILQSPTLIQYVDTSSSVQPVNKAGLTDGWQTVGDFISKFSSGEFSMYGQSEISDKEIIYLCQYGWYKNARNKDNEVFGYWFSGIEISVKLENTEASSDIQLPVLAAKVQLQQSKAQIRARTVGISGNKIDDAAPRGIYGKPFDIDTYSKLFESIDKIQEAAKESSTVFTPSFYLIKKPAYSPQKSTIAEVLALMSIQKKRSYNKTIIMYGTKLNDQMKANILSFYKKMCSPGFFDSIKDYQPTDTEADLAKQQLLGISEIK